MYTILYVLTRFFFSYEIKQVVLNNSAERGSLLCCLLFETSYVKLHWGELEYDTKHSFTLFDNGKKKGYGISKKLRGPDTKIHKYKKQTKQNRNEICKLSSRENKKKQPIRFSHPGGM